MKNRFHIIALGLMLLMLLSITPKTFLHELFANHTDVTACNDSDLLGPCIHKQGYNCQQTDLVVPNFYFVSQCVDVEQPLDYRDSKYFSYSFSLLKNFTHSSQGRAPPVHV